MELLAGGGGARGAAVTSRGSCDVMGAGLESHSERARLGLCSECVLACVRLCVRVHTCVSGRCAPPLPLRRDALGGLRWVYDLVQLDP